MSPNVGFGCVRACRIRAYCSGILHVHGLICDTITLVRPVRPGQIDIGFADVPYKSVGWLSEFYSRRICITTAFFGV